MPTQSEPDGRQTRDRDVERSEPVQSPTDYAPGGTPGNGDWAEASAAKTHTETSDTEPVYGSDPGGTTGDTTGEDRYGADDTRT